MDDELQVSMVDEDPGGGGEVVQVIMQEDGQILMPEGQFIQVNTDDGQPQYIQVTGSSGKNQLIQLMPDGQAHLVQVQEDPDGNTHIIQVSPESMDLSTSQEGGLMIVNVGEGTPGDMTEQDEAGQQMQLQPHMETLVLQAPDDGQHLQDATDHQLEAQHLEEGHEDIQQQTQEELDQQQQLQVKEEKDVQVAPPQPTTTIITIQPPGMERLFREQQKQQHQQQVQVVITSDHQGTNDLSEEGTVIEPDQQVSTDDITTATSTEAIGCAEDTPICTPEKPAKKKKLDMSSPIPLTTETVVVVNGKRCVLRVDPSSSNLVAYPFTPTPLPGKRGRGRPKKVRPAEGLLPMLTPAPHMQQKLVPQDKLWPPTIQGNGDDGKLAADQAYDSALDQPDTPTKKDGLSEQENSAAEGLLGLSEDGVRRSRRKRKRASFLSDYETGAVEGVVDDDEEDSKEGILDGLGKKPRSRVADGVIFGSNRTKAGLTTTTTIPAASIAANNAVQTLLMNMGFIPKKRGRGRPRRNPLPTSGMSGSGTIPAFIIPQPGGNAVMMAPIHNIEGLQRSLITIKAKPPTALPELAPAPNKAETPASIVIQNADGTKTQIITDPRPPHGAPPPPHGPSGPPTLDDVVVLGEEAGLVGEDGGVMVVVDGEEGEVVEAGPGPLPGLGSKGTHEDEEAAMMLGEAAETGGRTTVIKPVGKPVCDIMDSGALDDDVADPDYEPDVDHHEEEDEEDHGDKDLVKKTVRPGLSSVLSSATIIQLPDNLVSLVMPKKAPVKIGLKATESELEKLKCPKCDFQAYYQQQFQEHIATHIDHIHKCKCCNFLTFDKDGLLVHFREAHPKCICPVCDFTAEHAYIIKRHMMRHNANGCECNLCGKRYKDQYILKMHVKMVHMPAEVLYECQVCSKKFTRKAHLKRHLRIHEPEKPYKCSHCDYRGCERSDITKHLLIHEEPRHICEVCGKAFRHIKNKELHVKRHKGQRDYKCGVCDFYGYTFTDIRKHIERKHSDNRNILCDKCGSAFKNDVLLREHQKRQCEMLLFEAALPVEEEVTEHHTIQLVEDETGQHAIHVPHDQFQVVAAEAGSNGHPGGEQHILVNGNHVNITVEQVELPGEQLTLQHVEQLQVVGQMDDTLEQHVQHLQGVGEVTVVHMEDVVGHDDDDEDDEEDEEDELVAEDQLNIEEGEVPLEQIVVAQGELQQGAAAIKEAMLRVSKEGQHADEAVEEVLEGQVLEGQIIEQHVLEGEVLEGHVIEGQVMDGEVMDGEGMEEEVMQEEAMEGQNMEGQVLEGHTIDGQVMEGHVLGEEEIMQQEVIDQQDMVEDQAIGEQMLIELDQ